MKRLYTPFKVNKLELKNRVIMSPMSIGHTVDGFIMDDVVEFYKRRAQGGVGLIIFANMQWDKLRYNPNHGAMLTDEKYIPSLKKLTDAIHEGGSKVFAQLMHRGRCANRASIQGEQAVAPSPIPGRFTHFEMPKELTVEEIKEFVDWQAEAAVIAKKAGFDGIEIETNSGYLYGQFFSPLTNHRTDEYGGSLENRCRFMVETLEGMRAAVGPDYPISLRVSGSDFMDGGCNGDDIAEICELLDKTGYVDGFSITAGWHESAVPLITMEVPHGAWAYLGRQIKARVKAPVAQGMRMNIEKAEELVDRGDFDAIVMGRPFLADPRRRASIPKRSSLSVQVPPAWNLPVLQRFAATRSLFGKSATVPSACRCMQQLLRAATISATSDSGSSAPAASSALRSSSTRKQRQRI